MSFKTFHQLTCLLCGRSRYYVLILWKFCGKAHFGEELRLPDNKPYERVFSFSEADPPTAATPSETATPTAILNVAS